MRDIEDDRTDPGDEQNAIVEARLEEAVRLLMTCCDTVQIFITIHTPNGEDTQTAALCKGAGNYYARYGHVREWLIGSDHRTRVAAVGRLDDADDDEDDDEDDE